MPSRGPLCYDIATLLEMSTKPVTIRQQPLLPVLDEFSVGRVGKRLAHGAAAEM